jgi:hypothetical protein
MNGESVDNLRSYDRPLVSEAQAGNSAGTERRT